ncbi:MAG TPA: hypothetical protein DDY98_02025 [Ruminococcaceae bacterium]|nr:hypothetical protein [Oscillospiraceae bacterium]
MKRIIAVVLTFALLLGSLSTFASAAVFKKSDEEKVYVATMYVCQMDRNHSLDGHTWIYIKNLTKSTIRVGCYDLPKDQGVTIGTFGYSIVGPTDGSSPKGLYYNAEGYRYNKANTFVFAYLQKNLTAKQLEKVSNKILNSNSWSYFHNCTWAAFRIWNSVPGMFLPYLISPLMARISILGYSSHKSDGFKLYNPKSNQIWKQSGSGKDATLIKCDASVPKTDE